MVSRLSRVLRYAERRRARRQESYDHARTAWRFTREIIEASGSFNLQSATNKQINLLEGIRKVGFVIERKEFDKLHGALVRKKATFIGNIFADDGLGMRSFIVQDNSSNLIQFFSRIKS
jgi:hypothetical protein